MKARILAAVALCALAGAGCSHRLPNIKAEEIHSSTSFMGVKVSADALGVSTTDTMLKAADVKWEINAVGFLHTTTAKGYQQKRPKEADDKP